MNGWTDILMFMVADPEYLSWTNIIRGCGADVSKNYTGSRTHPPACKMTVA